VKSKQLEMRMHSDGHTNRTERDRNSDFINLKVKAFKPGHSHSPLHFAKR